jgi:hypothetical protein
MNRRNLFLSLIMFVSLFAGSLLAQDTTGTITGTVADSSGAVIPEVAIKLTSPQTGYTRQLQSSHDGEYKFTLVPIGFYSVTAEKVGFGAKKVDNVRVEILSTGTVNFILTPGEATQVVNVDAEGGSVINTETSDSGTAIKGEQINNLPLNVRQFMQLIYLAPMAIAATNDFRSNEVPRNVAMPAGAGQRPEQNNYQIDGLANRETGRDSFAVSPPVDGVGEFRVQTGLAPAEFGRGGGSVINVVSRGGTNQYHGSVYEFIRNDIFDAKPYFASIKSPLKRNQFGGSFGGPILHQKLFFFGNYEGLRQASTGNPPTGLVPTVAQKQGVFTTTIKDPQNNFQPFANNTIPTNRFDPISAKLLQLFPDPNSSASPAVNFIFNSVPSGHLSYNNAVARVDYNIGPNDTMFGRYLFDKEVTTTSPTLPLPAFSGGRQINLKAQSIGLGWNHIVTPNLVNSFSIGYTRYQNTLGTLNSYRKDYVTTSGITNTLSAVNPLFWAVPSISIPGMLTPGDVTPSYRTMNSYQMLENVVWTHGKHTFKFGGDVQKIQTDMFYTGANGGWTFANSYTGNNFADFLLGYPSSVNKTAKATEWNSWVWYLSSFAQDDWKITKRLTLNLGLRYEIESALRQSDHCGLGMTLQGSQAIQLVSSQCTSLPLIQSFSANIRPDVLYSVVTNHSAPYDADTNNVSPRFGFAYAVNDKTVVHGGYGIYYASPGISSLASSNDFAPDTLRPIWTANPTTPNYGWNPEGTSSAQAALKNAALTVFPVLSRSLPYAMIQEWNINTQRDLGHNLTLDLTYQGSKDTHLFGFDNTNFRAPGPGNVQSLLPYPQYARIQNFATWAAANYNGASIKIEQRAFKGLSYMASYTYAKSLDQGSQLEQSGQWSNPLDHRTAYGPSDFNATNRFVVSYTYQFPFGHGGALFSNVNSFTNKLISGWGVRGITQYQTGLPQTPTMNLSREGKCATACIARPDRIGNGNLDRGSRSIGHFYDITAFQVLPAGGVSGRIGNSGRNVLTAPPINSSDFSLFKETKFGERQAVEFRWENYNIFNHTQWSAPSVNMEAPATFGVVTGTADPRIMQFALRYSF